MPHQYAHTRASKQHPCPDSHCCTAMLLNSCKSSCIWVQHALEKGPQSGPADARFGGDTLLSINTATHPTLSATTSLHCDLMPQHSTCVGVLLHHARVAFSTPPLSAAAGRCAAGRCNLQKKHQLLLLYQTKNSGPAWLLSSSPASRPRRTPSSAMKVPVLLVW